MSEVTERQLEDMEALFVQTAASMTRDGETMTLQGLSPSTCIRRPPPPVRSAT